MITFKELVNKSLSDIDINKVKFVRHKDSRAQYRDIIKDRDSLLAYQAEQSKDVFKECEYIFSFIGLDGSKSLFIGAFKVDGSRYDNEKYYYDLQEVDSFEDYKDRVVIDWGEAAISWHQWVANNDKEVLEVLPKGYLGTFPGLLNFVLTFDELNVLINNQDANQDWYSRLSAVNGIYLILDTNPDAGDQHYVGAAYGKEGVWQRWQSYVKTRHGNNKQLKERCEKNSDYHKGLKFTLLQTLPANLDKEDVLAYENLYKEKLGSRVVGLNSN
ncbi:GIY-YIG nuclease family protein [Salinivibrio proteolyticus]|uniref:GIY-YIG nuclease family protein n=1 Tax=Salinivibrio proteolyticus TaxID=334715 RepID=UPI0009890AA3|nr:GIY-YIG nuclease family protein [Salinivibrio proteolyticus]OOF30346.1 hypothetical protein BZJ20_10780 [Salinivibrio proteolyticus]